MKKSTFFIIIGIILALCLIIAPVSASTITTLAQLQSACTAGGTHELGANISGVAVTIPSGKTLTLDLKTYTLTGYGDYRDSPHSVITVKGNLILNGTTGKITGGTYGGVYVSDDKLSGNSTFTMNGGNIYSNESSAIGGGILMYYSNFIMNGGTISNNFTHGESSSAGGGGIYAKSSNIVINGGDIIENSSNREGGGVFLYEASHFTFINGNIARNQTQYNGGGIYCNSSDIEIKGGNLIENKASVSNGGGIYFYGTSNTFYLSGNPVIKNNKNKSDALSNIYLGTSTKIILNGNLNSSAEIYVNYPNTSGAIIGKHQGYSGVNYIFSDNGLYMGEKSGDNIVWGTYSPLSLDDFTTNPPSSYYSPTNKSITLIANVTGTPTSYVWSYTTNPNPSASSSWINIGTTSTNSTTYTPTTVGTYTFRVVVSGSGTSVDSLNKSLKPYLQIFAALNGEGTSSNPYQVGSNSDLQNWNTSSTYYLDKYMIITQDFTPTITIPKFAGNLNGNDHTLSYSRHPLFNTLGGTVSNLNFENCLVDGDGLLANTSSATVSDVNAENCFISGNTTGGLVGTAKGSFSDCVVKHITVKGVETAAGIGGNGNMTINNCHVLDSDLLAPVSYGICSATDILAKIYTIVIPSGTSNSNSNNIWWGDDATGLTENQRNELIKDHSHFAVVRWDGTKPVVNYYLYRDNLNYRATDETCEISSGVASNLTGADGDVVLLYDQVWWKTAKSGNDWYITFTWNEDLTNNTWVTPHKYGDSLSSTSLATYVGLGVFEAFVSNNQMRSINTSSPPSTDITQNNFYNSAISGRNWQYNNTLPMTWAWYVIQTYFVKGNRDVQTAYGYGAVNTSLQNLNGNWSASNAWINGSTSVQTQGVTALGLHNPWGNVAKFMGEFRYDNGTIRFTTLAGKDHYNIETGSANTWKSLQTSAFGGYSCISEITGSCQEYPFIATSGTGTDYTKYYADASYNPPSNNTCAMIGGGHGFTTRAGVLCNSMANGTADHYDDVGSRLHVLII